MLCCSATRRALHLALVGHPPQLPGELRALREPGGAERVALGDQSAARVHDRPAAAVRRRLGLDELVSLAHLGEAERLVGDSSFVEKQSCSSITSTSSIPSSACASARSAATRDMSKPTIMIELLPSNVEERSVDDRLAGDLDGSVPEVVLVDEALGREDRAAGAVGGGGALELRQRREDLPRVLDVLQRVVLLELGVGVVDRVVVVLPARSTRSARASSRSAPCARGPRSRTSAAPTAPPPTGRVPPPSRRRACPSRACGRCSARRASPFPSSRSRARARSPRCRPAPPGARGTARSTPSSSCC